MNPIIPIAGLIAKLVGHGTSPIGTLWTCSGCYETSALGGLADMH